MGRQSRFHRAALVLQRQSGFSFVLPRFVLGSLSAVASFPWVQIRPATGVCTVDHRFIPPTDLS